jgi:hypothetical protein
MSAHVLNFNSFGYEVQFSQLSLPSSIGRQSAVSGISGKSSRCAPCRRTTDLKVKSQSKEVLLPSS